VAEELGEHLGVRDVVDRDPLDVGAALVGGAERSATGAAEAVDRSANRHVSLLCSILLRVARAGATGIRESP
jgi:hypothetical protein